MMLKNQRILAYEIPARVTREIESNSRTYVQHTPAQRPKRKEKIAWSLYLQPDFIENMGQINARNLSSKNESKQLELPKLFYIMVQ